MQIGENINRYRREACLTQEELGERVGVSMQAVSKWENGGVPLLAFAPELADRPDVFNYYRGSEEPLL